MAEPENKRNDSLNRVIYYFPTYIFVISLLFNFLYFNWANAPILQPDSYSYIGFADSLRQHTLPDFFTRTPTYPLYLLAFSGNLKIAAIGQTIIGALSAVLLYLIGLKLIKRPLIVFLVAAVVSSDFFIASFNSHILTESLSVFLLMLSLYLHILILNSKTGTKLFVYSWIADAFMIMVRPNLFFLPAFFAILTLIYYLLSRRDYKHLPKAYAAVFFGLMLNITLITGYYSLNLIYFGRFTASNLTGIAILGKLLQYEMIGKNNPAVEMPESAGKVLGIERRISSQRASQLKNPGMANFRHRSICRNIVDCPKSMKGMSLIAPGLVAYILEDVGKTDPYMIYNELGKTSQSGLSEANRYFLKGRTGEFIWKTVRISPRVMMEPRRYSSAIPRDISASESMSWVGFFFQILALFTPITLIMSTLIFFRDILRRNWPRIAALGAIMTAISYVIATIATFGYSDYSRLKMPVVPLIEFASLLMIVLATEKIFSIPARIFRKRSGL